MVCFSAAGGDRTLVGIATFDITIHFYNLKTSQAQPQILVMPDINDVYAPWSAPLLVTLNEGKEALVALLQSIPHMFEAQKVPDSCGAAAVEVRTFFWFCTWLWWFNVLAASNPPCNPCYRFIVAAKIALWQCQAVQTRDFGSHPYIIIFACNTPFYKILDPQPMNVTSRLMELLLECNSPAISNHMQASAPCCCRLASRFYVAKGLMGFLLKRNIL